MDYFVLVPLKFYFELTSHVCPTIVSSSNLPDQVSPHVTTRDQSIDKLEPSLSSSSLSSSSSSGLIANLAGLAAKDDLANPTAQKNQTREKFETASLEDVTKHTGVSDKTSNKPPPKTKKRDSSLQKKNAMKDC